MPTELLEYAAKLPIVEGITMSDVLAFPAALRGAMLQCNRNRTLSLLEMAELCEISEGEMKTLGTKLAEKGYLFPEESGEPRQIFYRLNFSPRERPRRRQQQRRKSSGLWDALSDD